jgi:hypothetical protein
MKKFIVLSLVALLVLAFGTMAFAQAKKEEPKLEFKISGFIDAKYFVHRNVVTGGPAGSGIHTYWPAPYFPDKPGVALADKAAWNETASFFESRARLKFDMLMGKNLSGTIFFEMDSTKWGEVSPAAGAVQRNVAGVWDADRAAVEVKNYYIDFGVPGIPVPVSMRVGVQPLSVRPNLLVYTDGPGVTAGIKVDPANIGILYFKAYEGQDVTADDINVYGLTANAKVGTFTVGGYGLYYNMNSYPLPGAIPAFEVSAANRADFWWFGLFADGKLGPLNMNFDFIYDTGEVESRNPALKDVDYSGWVTRLKLDFPWEKFNFGGTFLYATGADLKKTNSTGLPGNATWAGYTSKKVGSYIVPPGTSEAGICQESLVFYGTWSNTLVGLSAATYYDRVSRGTIGGTWFAKASAAFKATPWYKVTVEGLYIGDTTKNGNTAGDAVKANGRPRDDKSIGWELDLINEINIYKNLLWKVGAGMLFAGDALDQWSGVGVVNGSPKNPWILETTLTYSF